MRTYLPSTDVVIHLFIRSSSLIGRRDVEEISILVIVRVLFVVTVAIHLHHRPSLAFTIVALQLSDVASVLILAFSSRTLYPHSLVGDILQLRRVRAPVSLLVPLFLA